MTGAHTPELPAPFSEGSSSCSIGDLTIENGPDRIAVYGTLDLTRDRAGLALAEALGKYLAHVVAVLRADPHLPERIPDDPAPPTVTNPFA